MIPLESLEARSAIDFAFERVLRSPRMVARLFALLTVAVVVTACASQQDVTQLQQQIAAVNVALGALQGHPPPDEALRSEVKTLAGNMGTLETKVSEGVSQFGRLDGRLARIERDARDATTRVGALEGVVAKLNAAVTAPAVSASLTSPAGRAAVPPPAEQAYASALVTFRAREHGQAVLDFLDFLARYPKHPLGGNAQYWIGEAYFLQRDFRQATVEFEKVLEHGLSHPVVPDALFRVGMSQKHLRNNARAAEVWRRLLRDYPKSDAATKARGLLRSVAADATRR